MKPNILLLITAITFLILGVFIAKYLDILPCTDETDGTCRDGEVFMAFVRAFHEDSTFQEEHTLFPLTYITYSEEDPGKIDTFLIEQHQWHPLELFNDTGSSTLIQYGDDASGKPSVCNWQVVIEGMHSGEKVKLDFVYRDTIWFLSSLSDYSL